MKRFPQIKISIHFPLKYIRNIEKRSDIIMRIRVGGLQKPDRNIKRRGKKARAFVYVPNLAKGIRQRTNIDSLNGTLENGRFP